MTKDKKLLLNEIFKNANPHDIENLNQTLLEIKENITNWYDRKLDTKPDPKKINLRNMTLKNLVNLVFLNYINILKSGQINMDRIVFTNKFIDDLRREADRRFR